jgi:HNH endonuclease
LKRWTKEEEQFIRDNLNDLDNYQLAEKLGVTCSQIKAKINNLKIKRDNPRFRWIARDKRNLVIQGWKIEYLREHINDLTMDELILKLDASESTIRAAMRKHGIALSPEEYKKRVQACRFTKGHTPANKGKKMPTELKERIKHTFYPKGHKPHNTKYDGAISERTDSKGRCYKYIRAEEGKWVLLHRLIWEKHHGPLPDKHVVRFKNGNSLDVRIENLECISMEKNARRNHNRKKAAVTMRKYWANGGHYNNDDWIIDLMTRKNKKLREEIKKHPEIIELKRAQLKLRRAINESKSD